MEKEQSAVEKFLGNVSEEQEVNPFGDIPENEPEVEAEIEPKEEKPLPFNKDPKIQRFIEKEISKRLADVKPQYVERETPAEDKADDILIRLIGNDTPEKVSMVKEFKNLLNDMSAKGKQEALQELESQRYAELEADKEAEEELENAFESIEENFDVDITSNTTRARTLRSEFVSFVEKIAPKNRNGEVIDYPDMNSAWETFSDMKKATAQSSRAKELASRSMARSSEAVATPPSKRPTWDAADEFISSLK